MRLRIITPLAIVVDEDGVLALRAEDASGSFGVLPRHADFLTGLVISVVSWRQAGGARRCCAVRRGVLSISGGDDLVVATREAVVDDDIATLDKVVLRRFQAEGEAERVEHAASIRLQLDAIRRIMLHLQADRAGPIGEYS